MKQFFIIFSLVLWSSSFCLTQKSLSKRLPESIQNYLHASFPHQKVIKYKSEIIPQTEKHKVFLDNGISIIFDEDFLPYMIDSRSGLPDNVVPKNILRYVKNYFPTHQIRQWQIRAINQIVLLDDRTKIKFDSKGEFIRMRKH